MDGAVGLTPERLTLRSLVSNQRFDLSLAVNQTLSDAAGPSDRVPSSVFRVSVWS